MVRYFKDNSTKENRAYQIYLVLIGLASNRQTITYGALSEIMQFGHGGILAGPLGCIMRWCESNKLPALTTLVVEKDTGIPGDGLTTVDAGEIAAEQQRVFREKWFHIIPPSIAELAA